MTDWDAYLRWDREHWRPPETAWYSRHPWWWGPVCPCRKHTYYGWRMRRVSKAVR